MKRISSTLSRRAFYCFAPLFLVFLGLTAKAGSPPNGIAHLEYGWTKVFSGSGSATAMAVATDVAGNIYLTGYFSGTFDFDPDDGVDSQNSAGGASSFITRINADGSYGWTRVFKFPFGLLAPHQRIVTDPIGNVYLAANFYGDVDVDPGVAVSLVRSAGRFDGMIIKLSNGGDFVWARSIGGAWSDYIHDLTIDPSGSSLYVTGSFERTAQFDSVQRSDSRLAGGQSDAFVTRLGTDGSYGWTRTVGGVYEGTSLAVAADDHNVYLAGTLASDSEFAPGPPQNGRQPPGGARILFWKLTVSGDEVWTRAIAASRRDSVSAMAIQPGKGELFLLGTFSKSLDFDPGAAVDVHTAAGLNDTFVTRIDTDGSYAWTRTLKTGLFSDAREITAGVEGLYIAGSFHGTVDFNPGPDEDIGSSMHVLVNDIFLLALQDDGSYGGVDIFTWTGGTRSLGSGVPVSEAQGTVYVAGQFAGTVDFDPTAGVDERSSPEKHYSVYLTKLTGDITPPTISLSVPPDGYITRTAEQTLIGSVSKFSLLTVNGVSAPVGTDNTFSFSLTLQEGDNAVMLVATDAAGNTGQLTVHFTLDTQSPESLEPALIAVGDAGNGTVTVTGSAGSVEAGAQVYITNSRTGELVMVTANAVGDFATIIAAQAGDIIVIRVQDAAGNSSPSTNFTVSESGLSLPPDPAAVAPPIDRTVATSVFASTAFLYTGSNPIQTGVATDMIEVRRAAVLRGKVLDRNDRPLPGVTVSVLGHPEFGQTLSRADGMFDMAVNGGGYLTVDYQKSGYLPVQRQINVPWQDYALADDVVMVQLDTRVTAIDLLTSTGIQVAQGNPVTDSDGTRTATLLFPIGTTATMTLPDGSTAPLTTVHIRATEYTVGSNGPKTMPAALPPTSGYTYAVELSVDEAITAGATAVNFNQPIPTYVENFLGFPVGSPVPAGYYDRQKGFWMPSANGRVIEILGVTDGMADLDVSGNGHAASPSDLAALGVSDSERARLATLYSPGEILWRVPISHFSPWDFNWPFGPPPDATPPNQPLPTAQDNKQDDPDCQGGSIIECQNQILGERISIAGTPFSLNYRSDRVPGNARDRTLVIPLTGATVPASLKRVDLIIRVAGWVFEQSFGVSLNQNYIFVWDGKDAYGRVVQGAQSVTIEIGYVYDGIYLDARPLPGYDQTFGHFSYYGVPATGDMARREVTLWQRTMSSFSYGGIGMTDQRPLGLGGWSLDIHHRYDPGNQMLWLGDGSRRSVQAMGSSAITTVAGTGSLFGDGGDGGPAVAAQLLNPFGVAVAPDGSVLIADTFNARIRRIDPDGIITTVAGTGVHGYSGDGASAKTAQLNFPGGVAVAPDGSVLIADTLNNRIRRVSRNGIIRTVAGTGAIGYSGDGGPAVAAKLDSPESVAVASDGSILIPDLGNERIRRIGPDGIITTFAGTGIPGDIGDGGPAVAAQLNDPIGIAVAPDGGVLFAEGGGRRLRRVGPDGIITRIAGTGGLGFSGDGGPALDATLDRSWGVAVASDGSVLITDSHRIRHVSSDGVIITIAGTGAFGYSGDGGPAVAANMFYPNGVAVAPDGSVFVADTSNNRIRRIKPSFPEVGEIAHIVASKDGAQVYIFDPSGRHLRTLNASTGAIVYEFAYDVAGHLIQITDGDGNVTGIEHSGDGPTAITAPDGQRTTLSVDGDGYLSGVTNPAREIITLSYSADGLLTQYQDANGNGTTMTYDLVGRLRAEANAAGGGWTLSRAQNGRNFTVTMRSALGRDHSYQIEELSTGDQRRTNTAPDGTVTKSLIAQSGETTIIHADGTVRMLALGPDPRFSMLAPVPKQSEIKTPKGLDFVRATTRNAVLATAGDPLSLVRLTERTTINSQTYTSIFDALAKQRTTTTPAGRQMLSITDTQGRVLNTQVSGITDVNYEYDSRGRLSGITQGTDANTRSQAVAYDPQGYVASITDALSRTVRFQYDPVGRVTQQTLPDGRVIGYTYDADGNVTSVSPPGRSAHTFSYTTVNQTDTYTPPTLPDRVTLTHYTYNLDKQLTQIIRPDSQTIDYNYDSVSGRLDSITVPEGNISLVYDPVTRQLRNIIAPSGDTLSYTYDGFLPLSETWGGAIAGTVSRAYNNNFDVTTLAVNGSAVSYGYDDDQLLTQAGVETLTRDPQNGLLTATALGDLTTALSYNGFAELAGNSASYAGSGLYSAIYSHDNVGRIIQKIETIRGTTTTYDYIYDAPGRLSQVKENGATVASYSYDSNGNRISGFDRRGAISATVDAQDRLTSYNGATYVYTANGELQSRTDANGTTTYDYDVLGNLRHVTLANGTAIDYLIDGRNRRIGKKVNGALVQGFLYQDQLNPVAELDGSGAVVARFVYGSKGNAPDYVIKGGNTYRIISDHLGSPRLVVDVADGTIAQRLDYDEFGYLLQDTNPGFQPFGFAGGIFDRNVGLARFGARDYDASTGRWMAKDPIGFDGRDANLYAYVGGNPISRLDPMGLYWFRQPWQTDYVVGRTGSLVEPGDVVSRTIEDYVPAGRTFGDLHDSFVDVETTRGIPDWAINIPTMIPLYVDSVVIEVLRAFGVFDQPIRAAQVFPCK